MQVAVAYSLTRLMRQKVVIDERLGSLAGKLHHHSGGRIRIHVGILTGDVIALSLDYLKEHVAGFGTTRDITLVAIRDIALRNFLAGTFHKLELDTVLDFLHGHTLIARHTDAIGDFVDERFILSHFGLKHCLTDCRLDFFIVIAYDATVALNYCLYHYRIVL